MLRTLSVSCFSFAKRTVSRRARKFCSKNPRCANVFTYLCDEILLPLDAAKTYFDVSMGRADMGSNNDDKIFLSFH